MRVLYVRVQAVPVRKQSSTGCCCGCLHVLLEPSRVKSCSCSLHPHAVTHSSKCWCGGPAKCLQKHSDQKPSFDICTWDTQRGFAVRFGDREQGELLCMCVREPALCRSQFNRAFSLVAQCPRWAICL